MNRSLRIVITAGEHTCRDSADGPWCPFVSSVQKHWGARAFPTCALFGKPLPEVNEDGTRAVGVAWLGRLPECKAAEGSQ